MCREKPTQGGTMFTPGQLYERAAIHERLGGQQRGGISTPRGAPVVLLFTSKTGAAYGYHDRWIDDQVFLFTGAGQVGDMRFVRGNAAIRDHARDGKDLLLFEQMDGGVCRFVGQMVSIGHRFERLPDRDGNVRRAILFELARLESLGSDRPGHRASADLAELRRRALAAPDGEDLTARLQTVRERSRDVRRYVLARAGGVCEACDKPAPFETAEGEPFLEAHHIRRLSDGGPDNPRWVAAVCPNCHRRAHYGVDAVEVNGKLSKVVRAKEAGFEA
jgi:5-methylcytosine-specific restriction protein A